VLENPDMDRVTETQPYEGESRPSTIFAPSRNEAEIESRETTAALSQAKTPIVVKLSPRTTKTAAAGAAAEPGQGAPAAVTEQAAPRNRGVFIVLQGQPSDRLPFHVDKKSGAAGIVVPEESRVVAKDFFQAGQRYQYELEGEPVEMTVTGVFASPQEAQSLNPSLRQWYTLSPYEIMNLGGGPWSRR
jgi:hypothetical protein